MWKIILLTSRRWEEERTWHRQATGIYLSFLIFLYFFNRDRPLSPDLTLGDRCQVRPDEDHKSIKLSSGGDWYVMFRCCRFQLTTHLTPLCWLPGTWLLPTLTWRSLLFSTCTGCPRHVDMLTGIFYFYRIDSDQDRCEVWLISGLVSTRSCWRQATASWPSTTGVLPTPLRSLTSPRQL